jgi:hypothetical protein
MRAWGVGWVTAAGAVLLSGELGRSTPKPIALTVSAAAVIVSRRSPGESPQRVEPVPEAGCAAGDELDRGSGAEGSELSMH